jgi:hypothetical protein
MRALHLWREARGSVLKQQCNDLISWIEAANDHARRDIDNNIDQSIDEIRDSYLAATSPGRKMILRYLKAKAKVLTARGDWPSAYGLGIIALNLESRFVPGDDATYVKAQTEAVIKRARQT